MRDGYESVVGGGHYDGAHVRVAPTDRVKTNRPYTYQPRGCGQPGEYIQLTDGFMESLLNYEAEIQQKTPSVKKAIVTLTDRVKTNKPYTYQPRGCGQPGEYIQLTDGFIESLLDDKASEKFDYPEKHLVHEWAHYRYGVFDEYSADGDPKYPAFYMENGTIYPTTCVKGIKGRQEDMEGKPCKIYAGGQVAPDCRFVPDPMDTNALASIMFMPHMKSIEKFCQNDTDDPRLRHNIYAPNKQNIQCNYRSTWEVIESNRDFKNQ
ncbi:unnamed protein product [Medioppia subpectinata]|uniref:Calcium-activated chloride channel N-terminal domain-containing protein n=1 Tax=Medioppia subpectinata TaxID=1979941 RepID=A0A7R9L2F2_9ACAR|nr:unnamed protein product [Medioppia subpectinata]CAG2113137.1 unnamed protein product [Medioppia subpectinata]